MNIAISALKIIACFCIIVMHCGNPTRLVAVAVPLFMFVSMFLTSEKLDTAGRSYLVKRIKRIAIPYIAWGLIAAIPFSLFYRSFEYDKLLYQITLGSPYDPPLYFLILLMLYTAIVATLTRLKNFFRIAVLSILLVACFTAQYTGANYAFIESAFQWIPFFPRCTLGRFVELLPAALIGFALGTHSVKTWLCAHTGKFSLLVATTMALSMVIVQAQVIHRPGGGYDYQGIELTAIATCMGILTYQLGEKFGAKVGSTAINNLASLTIGVYVTHVLIANALSVVAPTLSKGPLLIAIVCALSACVTMALQKFKWTAWLVK